MTTPTTTTAPSPTAQQERVENALHSLLQRLVPSPAAHESESQSDARWDAAHVRAKHLLLFDTASPALPAEDVNFAAEKIKRRLLARSGGRPGEAREFANLYSRLLAQPVLSKKWAILYFMLRVAEGVDEDEEDGEEEGEEERVFDEAFARKGLERLPKGEEEEEGRRFKGVASPGEGVRAAGRPRHLQQPVSVAKSEGLEDGGSATKSMLPDESTLLRDLPFTLQGLSSTNLSFADKDSLKLPTTLPVPLISLLHTLAEPSLLYRSLSEFVEGSDGGLVGQSLRSAIGLELRSYLGLVATLEGQIRGALAQLEASEEAPRAGLGKAGVTLKRCVIWTREATLGLRLMSTIVKLAKGKKGGELISLIHNFASSHGDPFVSSFAERLLASITRPFYNMLRAWIYDGELEDPYHEFFVVENEDYEGNGATSVWEHKYTLKESMIPAIITSDFANRVFLIGKSLNFIRYGCGDGVWVESYSKDASRELQYGDTASLSTSIDEAYKTVMARLLNLLDTKFHLPAHLKALKKYLLLGQGDFIALLMESLATSLDRPANSQYRHTLTAQLEHAIRNSNAQFESADVLRRLDARMLELSHGEIGWDVFTLEYRVDSPLDVIVTPWASKQYLKIFNFLWRVKRVEFALASTWRRAQTGARGVLSAVKDKLGKDWKAARGGLAEMVHFVDQLQYYILFEVIEAGWEGLQKAMQKPEATLDTLIESHTAYLRSITRKGLLGGGGGIDFTAQLHELLKLMLAYRDAVDSLYSLSVAEFTRRQEQAAKIETRTKAGRWGITEQDSDGASPFAPNRHSNNGDDSPLPTLLPVQGGAEAERTLLEGLRARLRKLEVDFKSRVNILLGDLAYQPDVDMRFLGMVMNFNEVYSPVKRKRQHHAAKREERPADSVAGGSVRKEGG